MAVVSQPLAPRREWLSGALWAVLIVLVGVAVAIPDQSMDAFLVVGGAAAAIGAFIQPLVALPLLLFAIPFGTRTSTTDTTSEPTIGAAELLVALLALAWLARGVRRGEVHVPAGSLVVAILGMVALAGLSVGYALDVSAAVKEALKWLELLIAMVIVIDLVREPNAARWMIGALMIAGAAEAADGAMQFLTGSGPAAFDIGGALRAFGHFDQPNPFAGYLTTILPLAVCMALCRSNPTPFRGLAFGASALMAVGIGLSQSRGAWLGATVAALCMLLAWSAATRRLLIPVALGGVLLLALALTGALPAAVLDRISQAVEYFGVFDVRSVEVTSENWAVVERMAHWQAGWNMFLDHPWLGVGAGNYGQAYPAYYIGMWLEPLGHAHNYYINMLAELGVVGGGLLVTVLAIAFTQLGRVLVRSEARGGAFWRAVLAGVFGGFIVFCVHNLFDSLFVHSVNVQLGVLLGLGLGARQRL